MSTEAIKAIIGRAVADEAYREQLFADPEGALAGYDLSDEEREALSTLTPEVFEGDAGELEERLTRAGTSAWFVTILGPQGGG